MRTKRKLTPKQRVLLAYPHAEAQPFKTTVVKETMGGHAICMEDRVAIILNPQLGGGLTEDEAWANAARRLRAA